MAVTMDCLRGGGKVSVHFLAMVAASGLFALAVGDLPVGAKSPARGKVSKATGASGRQCWTDCAVATEALRGGGGGSVDMVHSYCGEVFSLSCRCHTLGRETAAAA